MKKKFLDFFQEKDTECVSCDSTMPVGDPEINQGYCIDCIQTNLSYSITTNKTITQGSLYLNKNRQIVLDAIEKKQKAKVPTLN